MNIGIQPVSRKFNESFKSISYCYRSTKKIWYVLYGYQEVGKTIIESSKVSANDNDVNMALK